MSRLGELEHPIVQAPMAGGPSTPALAAAVANVGALGFLAAGYLTPDALRDQIAATRRLTPRNFGVNLFSPGATPADPARIREFARLLAPLAAAEGVALGEPRFEDDHYAEKVAAVLETRPSPVSFAFGCPTADTVRSLHENGIEAWVTVTDETEARAAAAVGADAVVAQGSEAGGHRGSFVDDDRPPRELHTLLQDISGAFATGTGAPAVVAAGGIMRGSDIAAALANGANAVQIGSAFLLCPEAGTAAVHRRALGEGRATTLTRAFTGRQARGIVNAWTEAFSDAAPTAYPEIHHLTAPLRAHGRAVGNGDLVNLWAGTGHGRARALPAASVIATLVAELEHESSERGERGASR